LLPACFWTQLKPHPTQNSTIATTIVDAHKHALHRQTTLQPKPTLPTQKHSASKDDLSFHFLDRIEDTSDCKANSSPKVYLQLASFFEQAARRRIDVYFRLWPSRLPKHQTSSKNRPIVLYMLIEMSIEHLLSTSNGWNPHFLSVAPH
jgi:hypothetical protein